MNEFKRKEKIFSIDEESTLIIQKLIELNEQYQEINIQINDAEIYKENIADIKVYRNEMNADSTGNLEMKKLNDQLERLKNELSVSMITLKENHPDVKILRSKIKQLESRLSGEKSKVYNSIQSENNIDGNSNSQDAVINDREIEKLKFRKNYLLNQIKTFEKKLEELTKKQTTYEKLSRKFERDENTLIALKSKLEAAKILKAKDDSQGSIRIIDKAFPPLYPLKKKKIMFLLIGFVAASIIGVGTALVTEYLDETLKTPDEAEKYLDLPILGTIPKATRKFFRVSKNRIT